MHSAYKSDEALCEWLRENSSGSYRLSGYAAERIETLTVHLANVNAECDEAERRAVEAEKKAAQLEKESDARRDWFRRAKQEAGYDDSVSFDIVWRDMLEKARDANS